MCVYLISVWVRATLGHCEVTSYSFLVLVLVPFSVIAKGYFLF